jgi:hypothetical protein
MIDGGSTNFRPLWRTSYQNGKALHDASCTLNTPAVSATAGHLMAIITYGCACVSLALGKRKRNDACSCSCDVITCFFTEAYAATQLTARAKCSAVHSCRNGRQCGGRLMHMATCMAGERDGRADGSPWPRLPRLSEHEARVQKRSERTCGSHIELGESCVLRGGRRCRARLAIARSQACSSNARACVLSYRRTPRTIMRTKQDIKIDPALLVRLQSRC